MRPKEQRVIRRRSLSQTDVPKASTVVIVVRTRIGGKKQWLNAIG